MLQRAPEFLFAQRQGRRPTLGFARQLNGGFANKLEALADRGCGLHEGRRFLLREFGESPVEDGERQRAGQFSNAVGGRVRCRLVGGDALQRHPGGRCFRFRVVACAHAVERRNGAERRLGLRRGAGFEGCERRHDLALHRGGFDVAHHDDDHLFRAIPRVPEFHKTFARRPLDDFLQADRHAGRQTSRAQDKLELGELRAVGDRVARPLLTEDDAPFLFDFLRPEEQPARIIGQDAQAFSQRGLLRIGQLQHILRAVQTRGGVGIAAETHTHALEKLDQRAGSKVLAAVERHVFEEMRDPALVVLLVQRTGEHEQPQRSPALGLAVRVDDVAQSVLQHAEFRRRVGFEIARFMREARRDREERRDEQRENKKQATDGRGTGEHGVWKIHSEVS